MFNRDDEAKDNIEIFKKKATPNEAVRLGTILQASRTSKKSNTKTLISAGLQGGSALAYYEIAITFHQNGINKDLVKAAKYYYAAIRKPFRCFKDVNLSLEDISLCKQKISDIFNSHEINFEQRIEIGKFNTDFHEHFYDDRAVLVPDYDEARQWFFSVIDKVGVSVQNKVSAHYHLGMTYLKKDNPGDKQENFYEAATHICRGDVIILCLNKSSSSGTSGEVKLEELPKKASNALDNILEEASSSTLDKLGKFCMYDLPKTCVENNPDTSSASNELAKRFFIKVIEKGSDRANCATAYNKLGKLYGIKKDFVTAVYYYQLDKDSEGKDNCIKIIMSDNSEVTPAQKYAIAVMYQDGQHTIDGKDFLIKRNIKEAMQWIEATRTANQHAKEEDKVYVLPEAEIHVWRPRSYISSCPCNLNEFLQNSCNMKYIINNNEGHAAIAIPLTYGKYEGQDCFLYFSLRGTEGNFFASPKDDVNCYDNQGKYIHEVFTLPLTKKKITAVIKQFQDLFDNLELITNSKYYKPPSARLPFSLYINPFCELFGKKRYNCTSLVVKILEVVNCDTHYLRCLHIVVLYTLIIFEGMLAGYNVGNIFSLSAQHNGQKGSSDILPFLALLILVVQLIWTISTLVFRHSCMNYFDKHRYLCHVILFVLQFMMTAASLIEFSTEKNLIFSTVDWNSFLIGFLAGAFFSLAHMLVPIFQLGFFTIYRPSVLYKSLRMLASSGNGSGCKEINVEDYDTSIPVARNDNDNSNSSNFFYRNHDVEKGRSRHTYDPLSQTPPV